MAAAALGMALASSPKAAPVEEAKGNEIEALRQSLMKCHDVYVAVRDGTFSTVGCVRYSGEKMPGHMEYPKGAMESPSSTGRAPITHPAA